MKPIPAVLLLGLSLFAQDVKHAPEVAKKPPVPAISAEQRATFWRKAFTFDQESARYNAVKNDFETFRSTLCPNATLVQDAQGEIQCEAKPESKK